MPRFFFDFGQGDEHVPDTEGIAFATTEDAYLEAVEAAHEMWGDLLRKRCDPSRCRFEVRDANQDLLFVLPFQELIDNCHDRQRPTPSVDRATAAATVTTSRAKAANDAFQRTLFNMRRTLAESRALLAPKG
jgi:hypothetical protein